MDAMAAELGKVPPQQLEAEQSVLGGILLDSDGLPAALEVLKGDEFYRDAHRVIFRAAQELFERNAPIDLVTVADYLTQKTPLDGADYRRRAETGDLTGLDASKYDFLALRPAGASLEGFLYPDTYRLPAEGATAADLLGRQLDKFAEQVMPFWREAAVKGTTQLTLHQVLTLAGIIEREAPIHISNVMLVCPKCGKPTRVGHTVHVDGSRSRACKQCGQDIDA